MKDSPATESLLRSAQHSAAVASRLEPEGARLLVSWAASESELREAQRLRYRVFVTEMGACLSPPAGTPAGLDADYFDAYCDHLLVRAVSHDETIDGRLVGTYRVLPPSAALRAGGFYADTEFDLAPLAGLRAQAVELGRACVDPEWRSGSVIMALWSALGRYMQAHKLETMIGSASIGLADGGLSAGRLWQHLRCNHLVELRLRVRPYTPLVYGADTVGLAASVRISSPVPVMPPLIKGYLRCGARLLGPPAFDAAFNTADLPMMMRLDDLPARHRAHFLRATAS